MKRLGFIMLAVLAIAFSSCVKDGDGQRTENGGEVSLTLVAPGQFADAQTRAQLPSADENQINNATVVVFAANGAYDYHKTSTSITPSGGNIKVKVNLRTDDTAYDILVLTNLSAYFTDAQITAALTGATIDNAYQKLRMAAMTKTGWGETSFVMSGIVKNFTLTKTTTNIGTVPLIRSLASVDVGLNWNNTTRVWTGLNSFELEEVYAYNINTDYTVMPKTANYVDNTYKKVKSPTIYKFSTNTDGASTSIGNTAATAAHFDSSNITIAGTALNNTGNGQNLSSKIYLPETANPTGANDADRPALVIKGKWNNTSYYYRLDFAALNVDGTLAAYLDILRNHKYRFNIVDVKGPGYATADEAFGGKSMNIIVKLTQNDEFDTNNSDVNGQYYIHNTSREASFTQFGVPAKDDGSGSATKYTITLKTNLPSLSLSPSDFNDVTAGATDGSWSGPSGAITATSTWTNGHFTVVGKKGATVGQETTYTLEITSLSSTSPDPLRETRFSIGGSTLRANFWITQELPAGYRLVGIPDPSKVISTDGTAKRYPINIYSTHDYQVVTNNATMIPAVYSQETGGSALNMSSINKSVTTLWVDITAYPSNITPRLANLAVSHVDVASTAAPLSYTIVQTDPYLSASIGGANSTIVKARELVAIDVVSNIVRWEVLDFKADGVSVSTSGLSSTSGSMNATITLTLGLNKTTVDCIYTITFKDVNSSLTTSVLTITHKAAGGVPAVPGIIGWDPVAGLNLDGIGEIVYFKWGSLVGLSSNRAFGGFTPATRDDIIVYTPPGFNPTTPISSWTTFGHIPFLYGSYSGIDTGVGFTVSDATYLTGNQLDKAKNNNTLGFGDPCALATKGGTGLGTYKMVTGGSIGDTNNFWDGLTTSNFLTYPEGTANATWSHMENARYVDYGRERAEAGWGIQKYPAAGMRHSSTTTAVGNTGSYWSGTSNSSGGGAYMLFIQGSKVLPIDNGYYLRHVACPIRCIKQ